MEVSFIGIPHPSDIEAGVSLVKEALEASRQQGYEPKKGAILVVKLKAISKALGLWLDTSSLLPSAFALALADLTGKDPGLTEAILMHAKRLVRAKEGVLLVETKSGIVCANAMLDRSNTGRGPEWVLCPPEDIDSEAKRFGVALSGLLGFLAPVIVSDTLGRPFRLGQTDVAVGLWGLDPFFDMRGRKDDYGYLLKDTCIALADELAAGAELACGKTKGVPFVWVEGVTYEENTEGSARQLERPSHKNLFP
jgi:coenzyme F420-0:L-glutamate ligase/coenzyme F420-1:gamma-L-glutamate ligase